MIEYEDRVLRNQHVLARVKQLSGDRGVIPHLQVQDVLDFAKELEAKNAPLHQKVVFVESGKETGMLRTLRVDWKEDLINGEPAPQAAPKEIQ